MDLMIASRKIILLYLLKNYDYLLKTEILNLDNNIPWKNITDFINNSFIEKCNNCSDNTIYNITIKSWTNYTLVNVTTDNSVYLNVSSDIVINKTGNITTFINNTVNGNLSISLNDTLITINLMKYNLHNQFNKLRRCI
ncbi:hypothetical protein DIBLKBHL_00196 [Camelpox virus]|nr:hypothetical protein DIBLKBHL_00196 [Camelpox virus]